MARWSYLSKHLIHCGLPWLNLSTICRGKYAICVIDEYTREGISRRGDREVDKRREATVMVIHESLNFRSHNSEEILRVYIIHYKDNKCTITIRELILLKGSRSPSYKCAKDLGFTWISLTRTLQVLF
jgi:hypothetical protein